jgi:hypothetical protein
VSAANMYLVIIKNGMGAELVRTIGIVRARCKIGMTNLVYNKPLVSYLDKATIDLETTPLGRHRQQMLP